MSLYNLIFLKHRIDSTSSSQIRGHGRNKRVWTLSEDQKLVECRVELCVS